MYAGSPDSYDAFAPLFDSIINQYHKREPDQVHVSDMDYRKLESKIKQFEPEEAKLIKSTRIRVARNLAGQPLGPGMSREQRLEIESKVIEACNKFTGDLAGTYYSLSTLSDADRQSLIEDHFLFKEGDRFLEAAGLNRDWPEGRGIFHNNEKTFLVWINEEDQLRIISMQQGSDFGAVFSRLARASEEIEKVVKFAQNEKLGYLTSCPTNIGTGMRASVHISLPNLGEKMDIFQSVADVYNVQIRGIDGEHSESSDHVYDISNKQRLGRSEVQLVEDMYKGVKAMLEMEKTFAAIKQRSEEL